MTLYEIPVTTIDGQSVTLDAYRGRVLLIVNVASRCGFTPQYAGLEELYRRHQAEGFSVLGFPCNQFAGQEPGEAEEIKQFYHDNDLSVILHFLQALGDSQTGGPMQGGLEIGLADGLDRKLNIKAPLPIEQVLTIMPPLKPLAEIKSSLKDLIKRAYEIQLSEILAIVDENFTPCDDAPGRLKHEPHS